MKSKFNIDCIIYIYNSQTNILVIKYIFLVEMSEICKICCNQFDKSKMVFLLCNLEHFMCEVCYKQILNECPICKTKIDEIDIIIEKYFDIIKSANRSSFILCKDRQQQTCVYNKLCERLRQSNFIITSRASNEWDIDFKPNDTNVTVFDTRSFTLTNEDWPGACDSFAAIYILQMPFVSDKFANEKLVKCRTRMPKDWNCSILKL